MDKYCVKMLNAYTGEEVRPAIYCNGFAVLTATGEPNKHGCCSQGEIALHNMAIVELAGMMDADEKLSDAMDVVLKYRARRKTLVGIAERLKNWLKTKRDGAGA